MGRLDLGFMPSGSVKIILITNVNMQHEEDRYYAEYSVAGLIVIIFMKAENNYTFTIPEAH